MLDTLNTNFIPCKFSFAFGINENCLAAPSVCTKVLAFVPRYYKNEVDVIDNRLCLVHILIKLGLKIKIVPFSTAPEI